MLVVPNGFTAEDAELLALEPNSPPAGFEAAVFVWPKRVLEPPLVVGLPKENVVLGFAGSDMLIGNSAVPLGLGDLLAVGFRRGLLGLGRDILSYHHIDLPTKEEERKEDVPCRWLNLLGVVHSVVVASLSPNGYITKQSNTSNAKWS